MKKLLSDGLQILSAIVLTGSVAYAMAAPEPTTQFNSEPAVAQQAQQTTEAPVSPTEPAEQPKAVEPAVTQPEPQTAPVEAPAQPQAEPAPVAVSGNSTIWLQQSGIPQQYWRAVEFIITKESTWRVDAVNSIGCIGLGQSCPGGSGLVNDCPDWRTNPVCQLQHFDRYATSRYGGWPQAYQAWLAQGWW